MKRYYNSKVAYYIHGQYDLLMEEGNWRNQINQLNLNGGCNGRAQQQNQKQFHSSLPNGKNGLFWFVEGSRPRPVSRMNEMNEAWRGAVWWMELICFLLSFFWWVMAGGAAPGSAKRKRTKQKSKLMEFNQTKPFKENEVKSISPWAPLSFWMNWKEMKKRGSGESWFHGVGHQGVTRRGKPIISFQSSTIQWRLMADEMNGKGYGR